MLIRRAGVRVVGSRTAVASMRRALSAADRSQPPSQQSPSQQSQPPQTPQQRQLNMLDSFNMLSPDIGKTHVGGIGRGVLVVNGVRVHHSVVLLPRGYLHWHVAHMGQLTLESLALFTLLDPPVGTSSSSRSPTRIGNRSFVGSFIRCFVWRQRCWWSALAPPSNPYRPSSASSCASEVSFSKS